MSAPDIEYKQLTDEQLRQFDTDYLDAHRWSMISEALDQTFGSSQFAFLDVGGGNGALTDRILDRFPNAHGTLLDNSQLLLDRNVQRPRKSLALDSAQNIAATFRGSTFDVIVFNWILHHLVAPSYRRTIHNIESCVQSARSLLSASGRISIMENSYNGLLFDSAPSWLIFQLTSSRYIARPMRKLGANTAGVGVCFLSKREWVRLLSRQGLTIERCRDDIGWDISLFRRAALQIKNVHVTHFWCKTLFDQAPYSRCFDTPSQRA